MPQPQPGQYSVELASISVLCFASIEYAAVLVASGARTAVTLPGLRVGADRPRARPCRHQPSVGCDMLKLV